MINLDLGKPASKLIGVISKGTGVIYEPRKIKKLAEANAIKVDTLAECARRNADIPFIYDDGQVKIDTTSFNDLQVRMTNRVAYQELKKQQNTENVIGHAFNILESKEEVDEKEVDEDWIARFFNSAGEVSNEEMQFIWGKILAGEVEKPGSFSLRTLDTLRNITQEEAELFQKMSNYVFNASFDNTYFLYREEKTLLEFSINIMDLVRLSNIGLLNIKSLNIGQIVKKSGDRIIAFIYFDKGIIYENNTDKDIQINMPVYKLTEVGEQLFSIVEKKFVIDYLKKVIEKNKSKNLKIYYGEVSNVKTVTGRYHIENLTPL